MQGELTTSREDYLKAIIEAESEGRQVIPVLLSQWLGVSPPAVTKALRRLREEGYVADVASGSLRLTEKGRMVAHRTAFRHYLVERMLFEIFGMEWHQIHAEAERLEHVISPAFEAKLIEKLGEGAACPHGNYVLPESPEQIRDRGLLPLSEGCAGTQYRVASLSERDDRLLTFLHRVGIGPHTSLWVLERNYDETLRLAIDARELTLGLAAAEKVYVEVVPGQDRGIFEFVNHG